MAHALGEGYAVGQDPVDKIPQSERWLQPCDTNEEGYNISEGLSTKGFSGNWQMSTFQRGDFLFSITRETAQKYLPNTVALIQESIGENAS